MKKKFVGNLIFLVLVNLLVKPLWLFGVEREVQNAVGAEDYGVYFAIFNFSFFFQILLDFGIQNYNNRLIAQHKQLLPKYLPNILIIKTLLAVVYLVATFAIAFALQFSWFHLKLLLFLSLSQMLISFIFYLRSNISALHFFKTDGVLSVLDRVLMILIIGGMLLSVPQERFQIEWLVYGQTAAYFITAAVAFFIVLRKTGKLILRLHTPLMMVILKQSFPYALVVFLMTLFIKIDGVMLERLLPDGAYQAGIYAAGYRILDALNMIGYLFATLLLPMFSTMLRQKERIHELASVAFKLLFTGAVVVAVACFFFRVPLMELLYDEANLLMANTFGWLMFTFLGVSGMYIFGTLLLANGNLWPLNRSFLFFVCLNVVLNFLLIFEYGALGAAIATLITQGGVALVEIYLSYKYMNYFPPLHIWSRLILLAAGAIGCSYLIDYLMGLTIEGFLLVLSISAVWAVLLGLLRPRDVMQVLQKDSGR